MNRKIEKTKPEKLISTETKGRVYVEDKFPEDIKDWVIYLWVDKHVGVYFAVSKVQGQMYGQGWKIEKGISLDKKDTEARRYWEARRNAVTCVENTLNVLDMYGKKATDGKGEINWKQVQYQERLHSWHGALRKPRKFSIIEITPQEANKMKLT